MSYKLIKTTLVSLMLSASCMASAGLIYDNGEAESGATSSWYSSEIQGWRVYDDFVLTQDSNITNVFFSMGLTKNTGPFDGEFSFSIFNYLEGSGVGNQVYTKTLSSPDYSANLNSDVIMDLEAIAYDVQFAIDPLTLISGRYELSFYGINMDFRQTNVGSGNGFYQNNSSRGLARPNADTPFQLYGTTTPVPEPTTLAIFALGAIGLASRRFNKQVKPAAL